MNLLSIIDVTKRYNGLYAVRDLSFEVPPHSIYGLLGPNGAGKNTTIRMVMNIIQPDKGEIRILGKEMNDNLRDRIGYLPEERGLYTKMKVRELLIFLAEIKGMRKSVAKEIVKKWLEKLGLGEWGEKKVQTLPKGMQQKLQFLAAIIHDPELIILDEPFAGLDPINTDLLKDIILGLHREGKTIVFSTHIMEQVEKLCNNICLINRGKMVLEGELSRIKGEYGRDTVVMEFDGDSSFLDNPKLIRKKNIYERYVELQLHSGIDPQELLRSALERSRIRRFEIVEPSLHSIFIEKVEESNEKGLEDRQA